MADSNQRQHGVHNFHDFPGPVHRPMCTCIAYWMGGRLLPCVCGPVERCLRGWAAQLPITAMTLEQRAWCRAEIQRQGDSTVQGDFEDLTDGQLATQVLRAWADYCRDKGLI